MPRPPRPASSGGQPPARPRRAPPAEPTGARRSPTPRLAVGVAVALLVGLAFAVGATTRPAREASPPPPPPPITVAPAPAIPTEEAAAPTAPPPSAAPPPPISAGAPPGCPEDDDDAPGFVRPSPWELLRTRTQELRDRLPQLSRDASPALRAGLASLGAPRPDVDALRAAPDRDRDGFDVAVAALIHASMGAIVSGDPEDARAYAELAARDAPDDPLPHVIASLAASRLDRGEEARRAMSRADRLAPEEPALALAVARLEAEAGHFASAVAAADRYLAEIPDDGRTRGWRTRMAAIADATRGDAGRTVAGVTISWPRDALAIERVDATLAALRDALEQTARLMDRPRREALAVVIYRDRDAMRRATCAPSWSGGVFDGVLHLDAPTLARPDGLRVVRHEATHAQLASVRGRMPTWLNEGLAQDMEGPPPPPVLASWRRMLERGVLIPLASLEGALIVIEDPDDARLAYYQSLLMVRYLLERRGARAVREAIARIEDGEHEDLLERLVPDTDADALLRFLATRLTP